MLDIGCNAGFYSIEMKRRGADRVVGIDFDARYLAQARFAAEVTGQDIEFRELSVYDVARLGERFDIVLFMGVLYHLRHPLLALDLIHEHVAEDLLVFQSMQRGSDEVEPVAADYDFFEQEHFDRPGLSEAALHRAPLRPRPDQLVGRRTRPAPQAMLRSAGFEILDHPEEEVYVCRAGGAAEAAGGGLSGATRGGKRHGEGQRDDRSGRRSGTSRTTSRTGTRLLDPEWDRFARDDPASPARRSRPRTRGLTRVLGGMSPIDPHFIQRLADKGVLDDVDAVAVHGFPLDWNLWQIDEWPAKIAEIEAVTDKPVWVTEVGVSSFGVGGGAGLGRAASTAELLIGRAPRIHWYSLYDLPQDLGGHHAPQGGGGLVLLPALPHGAAARGRHAEAGAGGLCRLCRRDGPLPVVPFRGPPARRGGRAG